MIEQIFPLVSKPVIQCITWFESFLSSSGAFSYFIGGLSALIILRYLVVPFVRFNISQGNSASERSKSKRSRRDG